MLRVRYGHGTSDAEPLLTSLGNVLVVTERKHDLVHSFGVLLGVKAFLQS